MNATLTKPVVKPDLTGVDEPLTAAEQDELLLIEAAENKVKRVKDPLGRRRSFTEPRAWTLGGNVD